MGTSKRTDQEQEAEPLTQRLVDQEGGVILSLICQRFEFMGLCRTVFSQTHKKINKSIQQSFEALLQKIN